MTEATIEQLIVAMERKGWRLSCLSFIGNAPGYSCILERKKPMDSGRLVYAFNGKELNQGAREAVAEAWANAQEPVENKRVVHGLADKPDQDTLEQWLWINPAYRVALEDALYAHINLLNGIEEEPDDFL